MLPITRQISSYNFTSGRAEKLKYIVIHDVGYSGSTAKNNADYFGNPVTPQASAHYFVDDEHIYQVVEDFNTSWHCGDGKGKNGITNANSIGIEQIVTNEKISDKTIQNTIDLVKVLQAKYGIDNNHVVRHFDASGKDCPHYFNLDGKWSGWTAFKAKLTGANPSEPVKPIPPKPSPSFTKIDVDGQWGTATTKRLQQVLGLNIVDGVISHQYRQTANKNIYSAQFDNTLLGSLVIREVQRRLGLDADGLCGTATVKALQRHYGTAVDGVISPVSSMVMAMQRALNDNKF